MRRSCRIAIGGILWFYTFHPAHLGAEGRKAMLVRRKRKCLTRKQLEERGVTLGSAYVSEVFTNWKGGFDPRRSASYLGSLIATFLWTSLAQLGRGRFFVSAQTLHGHSINDTRVGAVQAMSDLDERRGSPSSWRPGTPTPTFGGRLNKSGRQYADADFGLIAIGSSFLNSSYGVMPTTPMPTYPEPAWGASLWITPVRHISFGGGVFRGGFLENPSKGTLPVKKQPFTIFETKLEPFSKLFQQGTYRFGIWQQARSAWLNRDCAAPVRITDSTQPPTTGFSRATPRITAGRASLDSGDGPRQTATRSPDTRAAASPTRESRCAAPGTRSDSELRGSGWRRRTRSSFTNSSISAGWAHRSRLSRIFNGCGAPAAPAGTRWWVACGWL